MTTLACRIRSESYDFGVYSIKNFFEGKQPNTDISFSINVEKNSEIEGGRVSVDMLFDKSYIQDSDFDMSNYYDICTMGKKIISSR